MKRALLLLFLIPVCVLSMLTVGYLFTKKEPLFLLRNIRIEGVGQLTSEEVMRRAYPFLKESIFGTDVAKVKEAVLAHPFVRDVTIKRVFPFQLVINVSEKQPSAMWVSPEGVISVLDEQGTPFRPLARGDVQGLYLIGATEAPEVKAAFNQVSRWVAEGIIKTEAISEVLYQEGNITLVGAEGGVEIILGKEDQGQRLKRAKAVLEDAKRRGLLIRCIDARFEKGAIVKERKG